MSARRLRNSPWSPARDAELRARWEAGETATQIAAVMGLTKNSIIGRAHRLQLASRPSPIRRGAHVAKRARPAPRAALGAISSAVPRPRPLPPLPPRPPPPAVTLSRTALCCWPLWPNGARRGHPDYGRFCCAPAQLASSYCPAHHARAWKDA